MRLIIVENYSTLQKSSSQSSQKQTEAHKSLNVRLLQIKETQLKSKSDQISTLW
jgi:hypothetical protein